MSCVWRYRALYVYGARQEHCIYGSSLLSLKIFKDDPKITTTNFFHHTLKVSNDRTLPSVLRYLWPSSAIQYFEQTMFRIMNLFPSSGENFERHLLYYYCVSDRELLHTSISWHHVYMRERERDRILSRTLRYCPFWKYSSLDALP